MTPHFMSTKHAALRIALVALALRLALLLWSPLELLGDEAHYWEWSRHPSLSYYTKGPGVAWVMAAGTALFGSAEWGLRFPAAILGFLGTLALAFLARRFSGGCHRTASWTALFVTLFPPFMMMALVMTIDAPFLCAWAVGMLLAWRILGPDPSPHPRRCALGLGLVLGLGFLAKYTILLLLPGLLLYGIRSRGQRERKLDPWVLPLAALAFLVAISPVILWNQIHEWPTVTHLLGHLRVEGGDRPARPWKPFATIPEFLSVQLLLLGPFALLLFWGLRRRAESTLPSPARAFLLWASLPNLAFYAAVSIKARVQANWPIPSYLGLLVLAAAFVAQATTSPRPRPSARTLRRTLRATVIVGLLLPLAILVSPALVGEPSIAQRPPLRRFTAGRRHAEAYQAAREKLREETGIDPLLITHRYDTTSLMAYYLPDRPRVFSARSRLGGRRSAYDFFPDTDLADPALVGKPALLFRGKRERWQQAFVLEGWRPMDEEGQIIYVERYGGPRP